MAPEIKTIDPSIVEGYNVGYGINPEAIAPTTGFVVEPLRYDGYGYNPNFNVISSPMPVQQDPSFSAMYNPMAVPYQFTYTQNIDQPFNQVGVGINRLMDNDTYVSPTVGFPQMTIEPSIPKEEPKADKSFNSSLITPVGGPIHERFGIQLLEDDVDRSMLPKPVPSYYGDKDPHNNKSNDSQVISQYGSGKMNNWFTRLLEQRGEDFITSGKLTIDEVSKNADRILDDMILGRIDYNKHGQYIIMPIIIETLISYCSNKLAINKAIQFSLGYTYNDYINRSIIIQNPMSDVERINTLASIDDGLVRNITQAIAIVNQDINVYEVLYNRLSYVKATSNATSLFSLANDLNNYKKVMKKRY